jgi:PAS domain S-box-containing protein
MRGGGGVGVHGEGIDDLPDLVDAVLDRSGTCVMVFDGDLHLVYVNEVAARVGGYPVDVHLGRRLGDLYPQIAVQAEPILREVLADQQPRRDIELVWESPRTPNRRRYWIATYVALRSRAGEPRVAAIYVETTAVRRAQDRLTTLIDALPTFVGMCDADGVIVEANEATVAATEMHREQLLGQRLVDAPWWSHDPGVQQRVRDAVDRAREGRAASVDVEVRVGDLRATIDLQVVPIVEDGEVTALVPSAIDITERIEERDRLRALAVLSRHLNGAMSTEGAAELVVTHAPAVVDAVFVNVALLDEDRHELRLVQPVASRGVAGRWAVVPLDGPRTPFHDALDGGDVLFTDRATRAERYPAMVEASDRLGLDTTASVPLTDAAGEVFGFLGVGWSSPVEDQDAVRPWLALLADLCGHALRRAQRTETQGRFVRQLQDEALAAPDIPRDLDVAVTYEPAQADIGFGGDWYDVVTLDRGRTAMVVGDVAGHGIAAAARMTEAKATIRAMVLTVPDDDVIPAASRSFAHLGTGYVATVAVAWVDTEAELVGWRLAGHPPPVLRSPDGAAQLLTGGLHPPIGMPTGPRSQDPVPFPPGSLLVLYTDGLVERRGEDLDVGLERLRRVVTELPDGCSAGEARDALLRELHVDDSTDDVALVVVRNR